MKSKKERGFGLLLELLIAMAITTILLAGSTALVYRVRAVQNQADAQMRLRQIAQAEATIAICAQTVGCIPSVGLTAIIPPDGSVIQQSGYTFTFNWNHGYWTYTAVPAAEDVFSLDFYPYRTNRDLDRIFLQASQTNASMSFDSDSDIDRLYPQCQTLTRRERGQPGGLSRSAGPEIRLMQS